MYSLASPHPICGELPKFFLVLVVTVSYIKLVMVYNLIPSDYND
jgi:hypothetical protein